MTAYAPAREVVLSEMDDGTAVLLHMRTKFYFTLNKTGLFVWRQLEAGVPLEDLSAILSKKFIVDSATAQRDIDSLVSELLAEQLLLRR